MWTVMKPADIQMYKKVELISYTMDYDVEAITLSL